VLHEEARLADELAGALRLDAAGSIAPLLRLRRLFLLVVVLLFRRRDAVLQDRVQVGLHVVGVGLLLVVVVALVVVALGLDGHDRVVPVLVVLVDDHDVLVEIVDQQVVTDERIVVEVLFVEVFGLVIEILRILDVLYVLVLDDLVVCPAAFLPGGGVGGLAAGS
jgi:hypothetical protein